MIGVKRNQQSIVWRIEGLKDTPPELIMLINTTNLNLAYIPIITETRTKSGFAQEFWGEQLTSLSSDGQMALSYNETGLTNRDLRSSEAFQNLQRLINIYKNNGKVYDNAMISNKLTSVGTVVMAYMTKEYEGYFESFDLNEAGEKPFTLNYSLAYKVTRVIGDFIVQDGDFVREEHG